jgi:hypothetical protein
VELWQNDDSFDYSNRPGSVNRHLLSHVEG